MVALLHHRTIQASPSLLSPLASCRYASSWAKDEVSRVGLDNGGVSAPLPLPKSRWKDSDAFRQVERWIGDTPGRRSVGRRRPVMPTARGLRVPAGQMMRHSTAYDRTGPSLTDTRADDYRSTTILIGGGASVDKTRVLASLDESAPGRHAGKPPFDAALVLASTSLTSWLDDAEFIASLLRRTGRGAVQSSSVPPEKGLTVLSAVVDGLVVGRRKSDTEWDGIRELAAGVSGGMAVVQGYRDQLLPELREAETPARGKDGRSGLVFRLPGWEGLDTDLAAGLPGRERVEMEVTVPVANTVFQNGRTSTMFASRWAGKTWDQLTETDRVDVRKGVVDVPLKANDSAGVAVPLVSITPLRPVQAALGNILKTLQYDGGSVPASKELEANVPMLLGARSRMGLGEIQGPLNVWALVVPQRVDKYWRFGVLRTLPVQDLLKSGCRLHRVLSGGGGWGAKQGLLSLDPETRFETTDEEDVEMFERDFMANRLGDSGGGSVVGPGDQVVFCVDTSTYPLPPDFDDGGAVERVHSSQSFAVKIRPETITDERWDLRSGYGDISRIDDFFGVVAPAMYVAPATAPGGSQGNGVVAAMKIDAPGAELSVGDLDPLRDELKSLANELATKFEVNQKTPTFTAMLQAQESAWAKYMTDAEKKKA